MHYKVGMYGGAFDPLHAGHLHVITQAAALCEELYVILSWSKKRDRFPVSIRYRWLKEATEHLPHVRLLLLEDRAESKEEYTMDDWVAGAKEVRAMIGKKIDVVFCGNDHASSKIYEQVYPESEVHYFRRIGVPISFYRSLEYPPFSGEECDPEDSLSSTKILKSPYKYWDCLATPVRPYLVQKVLIVGTESTGKSTLVRNLAQSFRTNYVEEYGRKTCEHAGGEGFMITDDFYENILMQAVNIRNACKTANRVLFVDTDALTTAYYAKMLRVPGHEMIDAFASAVNDIFHWDLVIYLEPDVPFIQDGTRNEDIKENRDLYNKKLKTEFESRGIPLLSLKGDYHERLKKAKESVELLFDTRFAEHSVFKEYHRQDRISSLYGPGWSKLSNPVKKGGKKNGQK